MSTMSDDNETLPIEKVHQIREALLRKREELLRHQTTQLNALFAPDKHHLADLEEMASDTMDTDSLCALVDLGSSTLSEIDVALQKIEQGTYGSCELCDRTIHPDRLEILPFASLCVHCQRKKEQKQLVEDRES